MALKHRPARQNGALRPSVVHLLAGWSPGPGALRAERPGAGRAHGFQLLWNPRGFQLPYLKTFQLGVVHLWSTCGPPVVHPVFGPQTPPCATKWPPQSFSGPPLGLAGPGLGRLCAPSGGWSRKSPPRRNPHGFQLPGLRISRHPSWVRWGLDRGALGSGGCPTTPFFSQ